MAAQSVRRCTCSSKMGHSPTQRTTRDTGYCTQMHIHSALAVHCGLWTSDYPQINTHTPKDLDTLHIATRADEHNHQRHNARRPTHQLGNVNAFRTQTHTHIHTHMYTGSPRATRHSPPPHPHAQTPKRTTRLKFSLHHTDGHTHRPTPCRHLHNGTYTRPVHIQPHTHGTRPYPKTAVAP